MENAARLLDQRGCDAQPIGDSFVGAAHTAKGPSHVPIKGVGMIFAYPFGAVREAQESTWGLGGHNTYSPVGRGRPGRLGSASGR